MFRARLATFVLLAWPTAALAQEGAIGGTVTNEEGLAMPSVTVTATGRLSATNRARQ